MMSPFEIAAALIGLAAAIWFFICRMPRCPLCGRRDWDTDSFPKHMICKTCRSVFHG